MCIYIERDIHMYIYIYIYIYIYQRGMYYVVQPPVFLGFLLEKTGENGRFWFSENGLHLGCTALPGNG